MSDDEAEGGNSFKPGNTDAKGNYLVGKNRPPEDGKFRKGDGRRRGGRKKGTKNLATDFHEELSSKVVMKVDGKARQVTKQRAVMMRLMDNASRGQNAAIRTIMEFAAKFGVELQLEDEQAPAPTEYKFMDRLTEYEMELLGLILAKASGEDPSTLLCNERLYDEDHPLAYLENPDDQRNFDIEVSTQGVSWKRYNGMKKYTDHIVAIRSDAYALAVIPRPSQIRIFNEELCNEA